jgi:hypothetical protein
MSALPLHCPLCAGVFQVDSTWAGQQVTCPLCRGVVVVPSPEAPVAAVTTQPPAPSLTAPLVRPADVRKARAHRRLRNNVIAFAICIVLLFAVLYFLAR